MSTQPISELLQIFIARLTQLQTKLKSSGAQSVARFRHDSPEADLLSISNHPDAPNNAATARAPKWWARIERGLVMDDTAKHFRRMKLAVWLYLYFLVNADWKTGTLFRRLSTISKDTGISPFTVRRWLRVLQRNGYVDARYNGHFWTIAVTKWKPLASRFGQNRKPAKPERAAGFNTCRIPRN